MAKAPLSASEVDDLFSGTAPSTINREIDDSVPFGPEDFTRTPRYKWSEEQWAAFLEMVDDVNEWLTARPTPEPEDRSTDAGRYPEPTTTPRLFED